MAALLALASTAAAGECRLALVLALDVSASVDPAEDRLQREGLARALLAPEVAEAFLNGDPVALFAFEWAGPAHQANLTPGWRLVRSEDDLLGIAQSIRVPRAAGGSQRGGTALGTALLHAAAVLDHAPPCRARTIDVSGDGENNQGPGPADAYRGGRLDGTTVNALVIDRLRVAALPPEEIPLVAWYRAHVLHGPEAFWVLAQDYEDYERAMTAKLLRELERPVVSEGHVGGRGASG